MAIDIFNPDLAGSETRREFTADDIVGRFRSGYQINDRPASLKEWRVTTGDPDVADAVHGLLDGDKPQEWETKSEETLEVFTASPEVNITLSSMDSVDARMLIWPRGQKKIVTCDGEIFETEGRPYVCETGGFRNRKEHEEGGHVCDPRITVTFRLADEPDLGLFKFETGAWSLVTNIARVMADLRDALEKSDGEPVKATLALEQVTTKAGKQFTKPVITVKG